MIKASVSGLAVLSLAFAVPAFAQDAEAPCDYEIVVLGAGQDAGAPQIGNAGNDGPRLLPSSLALIDWVEGTRYLFDATPAITEQLAMLDSIAPPQDGLGVDGVFLTHAHIGHYLGLAYFGREAAGASGIPVYAMPRLAEFLISNGPWSQLVELENIELIGLGSGDAVQAVALSPSLVVVALPVPHRDEFSETVGLYIMLEGRSALYLPDIDSWEGWTGANGPMFDRMLDRSDHVFIDATFWDDNELPGRDMSEIPHPRVTETMDLLQDLPASERAKVHFIHYNHTNPIRDPNSPESREVAERGFNVARRGDRFCL
ncbi:MBL fold metallo-hydrolase [Aurantiacibacter sp. MUD61]|uniref:MBL fold metallo-hydrolase n=1 Tax=Aurantiacibacter sp. MUD61 TaxID=3009083 RepID=UPI0022EFF389|nr:MBL fold metallo-hydrolase [Aurantiacibacter sp. MUD61]